MTGAAGAIDAAGAVLGSTMDRVQADADQVMAELDKLINGGGTDPAALLAALEKLSGDLTAAGGAAADIIGAGSSIAGAMAPYIAEAAVNLNEHLGYAMQSLQAASNSLTSAVAGVRGVLNYLNGLPDVQFQGLGSEYSQRVDSLCGNMRNISDALTALNTEVGNSATVLVSDLRKVNDQFSVVMLMLVDAIKAAASPAIGDVFTDVSEEEGSATDGNVAGCGNTGAVYGDVNVGGITGRDGHRVRLRPGERPHGLYQHLPGLQQPLHPARLQEQRPGPNGQGQLRGRRRGPHGPRRDAGLPELRLRDERERGLCRRLVGAAPRRCASAGRCARSRATTG